MRSPYHTALYRGADADVGGAVDLQTDVMRFMAILALCLVAIFALVQSLPLAPAPPLSADERQEPAAPVSAPPESPATDRLKVSQDPVQTPALNRPLPPAETAATAAAAPVAAIVRPAAAPQAVTRDTPLPSPPAQSEPDDAGFSLRFASDTALMRLVASHQVGVYALVEGRARRMSVRDSRVSFWDASMPTTFREMQAETVPHGVAAALGSTTDVTWGVTLPGRLSAEIDALMQAHTGGALIISADGRIRRESEQ